MNLATLALTLYLRNPVERSISDDPLIVLPNGKRIVIQTWDEAIDPAKPFNTFTLYRLFREYRSSHGVSLARISNDCYDLEAVSKTLAEESATPESRMPIFRVYSGRRTSVRR